jgi:hypothetical protein
MIIIIMVVAHVEDLGPISLALPDGCRPTMVMAPQQTMNMMNTINEHNPHSALLSSTTPNGMSYAEYV